MDDALIEAQGFLAQYNTTITTSNVLLPEDFRATCSAVANSANYHQVYSCMQGYDLYRTPVITTTTNSPWGRQIPMSGKDSRAIKLLVDWLDDAQLEAFQNHGCVYVWTKGGRLYLISEAWVEMVCEKENEPGHYESIMAFCLHPSLDYSVYDKMLTQKLWLETDEEEFLRWANVDALWEDRDTPEGKFILASRARRVVDLAENGTPVLASELRPAMEALEKKERQFAKEIAEILDKSQGQREIHSIEAA